MGVNKSRVEREPKQTNKQTVKQNNNDDNKDNNQREDIKIMQIPAFIIAN